MTGEYDAQWRENTRAMLNRKGGLITFPVVTRAGAEWALNWHHRMHTLPEAHIERIQNDDGTFPLLKGWDLPQD